MLIPEHDTFFRLDHLLFEPGSASAAAAVLEIERSWWISIDQMARAGETGSIWTANWMTGWPATAHAHAAADLDVLLAAIAPRPVAAPETAPRLLDLVDGLRVAVSRSPDLDSAARARALRMIGPLADVVTPARIIVPG